MSAKNWTYHRGDDYAVVMLPGEDTCTATINITADPKDADKLGAKIQAIPDMLAALHDCVAELREEFARDPCASLIAAAIKKAEAAIAKAEGKR